MPTRVGVMPFATASRDVHVEHVMGTVVSLDMRAGSQQGLDAAMSRLHEVDARFSPYRPDSEIARLERGELLVLDASPDVRAVLERCAALTRATGGFFRRARDGSARSVGPGQG